MAHVPRNVCVLSKRERFVLALAGRQGLDRLKSRQDQRRLAKPQQLASHPNEPFLFVV